MEKRGFLRKKIQLNIFELDLLAVLYISLGILFGIFIIKLGFVPFLRAAPITWSQTDWSGGEDVGTVNSGVTTYASKDLIDTNTVGEIKLENPYENGVFKGNQLTTSSSNYNISSYTSLSMNVEQDFVDTAFSYDSDQPGRITVDQDGDYLLGFTLTTNSSGASSTYRNAIEAEIRVNGTKYNGGVARSSYMRNSGQNESSLHNTMLLTGLSTDDYIEVYVRGYDDLGNSVTGDSTIYLEKIESTETVFSATAVQKVSGTDLNSAASELQFTAVRSDSGYTHSSNSEDITLNAAGNYFVSINLPISSSTQRANLLGKILLDGVEVTGGEFKQGYVRNADGHDRSTLHWNGIVTTTSTNQVLSVSVEQESENGTVTVGGEVATLFVQKIPTTGVAYFSGTQVSGADNWNSNGTINWSTQDLIDTNIYSHNTSTSNTDITVLAGGDYVVFFNAGFQSTAQRPNIRVKVNVNGSPITGAETKTAYIRNSSAHNQSSTTLYTVINDLLPNDIISITTEAEGSGGTVDDTSSAILGLWHKSYSSIGTLESNIFDPGYSANWSTLTYTSSGTGTVEVRARTSNNSDMSGSPDWSTCGAITSSSSLASDSCVTDTERYIQYQVQLTPQSGNTPVFEDISLEYEPSDQVVPTTNATNVAPIGISSGDWTNSEITINWDDGVDDVGGSGILGYCIALDEASLGSPSNLDPSITGGILDSLDDSVSQEYCPFIVAASNIDLSSITGLTLTTGNQYYFSIKAVDLAGNIWTGATNEYQNLISFKYDSTVPKNPLYISLPVNFIATKDVTITWPTTGPDSPSDNDSGLIGLQYRIGGSGGTWYGDNHNGNQDLTDLLANDGSYTTDITIDYPNLQEGANQIQFRTVDAAGNYSTSYTSGVIKINTLSPSNVNNIQVTPTDNTVNEYQFSWNPPTTYGGSLPNITYCYSVNTLPNVSTCTYTAAGENYLNTGAYATQPGVNTMYIVARDEASNINYATYDTVEFTYSGSAPGIPLNLDVSDISIKSTSNWRLALAWDQPTSVGAGISEYRILRSSTENAVCTSNINQFTEVARSSSSSYIDTGLSEQTYSYCIKACDSANNCSAVSSTESELPTGRFTEPPSLISEPNISLLTTRRSRIEWVTDRLSNGRIQLGTEPGIYFDEEISSSEETTAHLINLNNLDPGTTYYYKAKWTDEDGNIGVSDEKTFQTLPAPTIVNISAQNIRTDSAVINFTLRNATKATLLYGQSEAYGGSVEITTSTDESAYSIPIDTLLDGTIYNYKLLLEDLDGYEYDTLQNNTFTTVARPRIENVAIEEVKNTAQPTVNVTWDTNTQVSSIVTYYPADKPDESRSEISLEPKDTHGQTITALLPNTRYALVITGRDVFGNEGSSDTFNFTTATDSRPPAISNIKISKSNTSSGIGGDESAQLIVSWETDEGATSQIDYGEGSGGAYNRSTPIDNSLQFKHVVVISDLRPNNVYNLRVISADDNGNSSRSKNVVTITQQASVDPLELVLGRLSEIFSFLR